MDKAEEIKSLLYRQAKALHAKGNKFDETDDLLDELSREYPGDFAAAYESVLDETLEFANAIRCSQVIKPLQGMIVMKYIAENYFHRTNGWLHQRINGNQHNGKRASFTDKEMNVMSDALEDISRKLHEAAVKLKKQST